MQGMQAMWVQALAGEDPLEKDMATHSSILAWRIPRTEDPGGLLSMKSQESDTTSWLNHHHSNLVPSLYGKQMRKQWKQWETLFLGATKSLQMVTAAIKLKDACSLDEMPWPN